MNLSLPTAEVRTHPDGETIVGLFIWERPWTTNAERRGNRWTRAEMTERWRKLAFVTLRNANAPQLTDAKARVRVYLNGRLQDCGACHPAVKAVIDGFVDARVLADDDATHLKSIEFVAPERHKSNFLVVELKGRLNGR